MTRAAQGRLARLEGRHGQNEFDHLTDEEIERRADELLVQIVAKDGVERTRAKIEKDFPEEVHAWVLGRLQALENAGLLPHPSTGVG